MNTPSNKDTPNWAHIEAIMDRLSKVDTTITLAEVLEHPELESVQSDVLITQKVEKRLLRARSQDIREIYIFIEQLDKSGLTENTELSILLEIKMELADNLDKPITDIIKQSYLNMIPMDSVRRDTSHSIDTLLNHLNQHDAPSTLQ